MYSRAGTLAQELVMVRQRFIPVLAGLLVLVSGGVAVASPQFRQTGRASLSGTRAGAFTGAALSLTARDPGARYGQPKAMTKIVVQFPAGTVYNPRGALQCTLPDESAAQCPDASQVGAGRASTHYGELGGGETYDRIELFHRKGGLYVVVRFEPFTPLGQIGIVLRAKLSKRGVLSIDVPRLPAPPGLKVVFTQMAMGFEKQRLGNNLLTTPSKCDRRKGWRSKIVVSYEDGSKKTLESRQKCRP
jgi:hypothetical protein